MNMFAHLKSKPEMLSANDLLEIFRSLAAASTTCSVSPAFHASTFGRRIIVPRDAMIDWLENRLQEELNSAAKSRESNEVSVMPETESEADTDLPETQIREDGVYIKVLPRDMKKPQAI